MPRTRMTIRRGVRRTDGIEGSRAVEFRVEEGFEGEGEGEGGRERDNLEVVFAIMSDKDGR